MLEKFENFCKKKKRLPGHEVDPAPVEISARIVYKKAKKNEEINIFYYL